MISTKKYLIFLVILAIFSSCKKSKKGTTEVPPPVVTTSRADLTRDSIFLYAKEIYFWNDALPTAAAFNARSYTSTTSDLTSFNNELFAISQFKINPATGLPFENSGTAGKPKYSYIQDRSTKNPTAFVPFEESAVDVDGNGNDFGIALTALTTTSPAYRIYVRFVSPGSPADKAGLKRGDVISKINGTAYGANFANESATINTALNQTSITLTKESTGVDAALAKTVYKSSPIYKSRLIDTLGKKIGYLAFARFSSKENSEAELLSIFNSFASGGATSLVIDLRYNGGGYVSTAQTLSNLIAPSSLNGTLMFVEHYNSLMQANGAKILTNQPLLDANDKIQYRNGKIVTYADVDYSAAKYTFNFSKQGNLDNIRDVVFIVTGSTASASELVINNLKPHLNVKLVGATTYGKPIGFFPVTIDKYDVYFSLFQSKNSLGQGDYYAGMVPDQTTFDDVRYDFGSSRELSLASALAWLTKGTFTVGLANKGNTISSEPTTIRSVNLGRGPSFIGSIETRYTLKQ